MRVGGASPELRRLVAGRKHRPEPAARQHIGERRVPDRGARRTDTLLCIESNCCGKPTTDLDIWVAYRASEDNLERIERLPVPVNTGANEFCPTPLPGNRLLFVSTRTSACSGTQ